MESSSEKELSVFLQRCGGIGPFQPCVMYNKTLDMIVVSFQECSATSVRASAHIEVLLDNYPRDKKSEFVGFYIHGVRSFIKKYFDYDTKHKVSVILSRMESFYSPSIFGEYKNEIQDALNHFPLEIDIAQK